MKRRPDCTTTAVVALGILVAGSLTILGAATSPVLALAALPVLGVILLALLRPIATVYLAVLLIPLEGLGAGFGHAFTISPAEFVAVAAAAGWIMHRLASGGPPLRSPLTYALAGVLLVHIPGLFVAANRFAVMKETVMWSAFFVLFLAVISERRPGTAQTMANVIAASGAIISAIAVVRSGGSHQALVGLTGNVSDRATGSFGSPTLFAAFVAITLPLQLRLALCGSSRIVRLVSALGALASTLALALAMTRSVFVALAVIAAWLVFVWKPFRRITPVLVLCGVVVLSGITPLGDVVNTHVLVSRIESVGSTQSQTAQYRLQLWKRTPKMIEDHLAFGVGADNFQADAARYGIVAPGGVPYTHAHDIALTFAAEFGLPGLAVLAWLTVALAQTLRRLLRSHEEPQYSLAVCVTAALLVIPIEGVFDYTFSDNAFFLVVVLLAAIATRQSALVPHAAQRARTARLIAAVPPAPA
ncbi:MAG TPA: O-antigen ligase family protein [Gaiellaceae bacterium]